MAFVTVFRMQLSLVSEEKNMPVQVMHVQCVTRTPELHWNVGVVAAMHLAMQSCVFVAVTTIAAAPISAKCGVIIGGPGHAPPPVGSVFENGHMPVGSK